MVRSRPARPAAAWPAAPLARQGARAAALAATVVLLFLRKPDALLHPQLFAEDGCVFFRDAYLVGARSLLQTYGGYFHLLPRVVALAAIHLDPAWTPKIYGGAALAAHLSVIGWLFSPRVALPAKPALAAAFVLVPHNGEVWLNLTNAQWSLSLVLVLLAIAGDPERPRDRWIDGLWLIACGLTGPFLLFLLPIFALRALHRTSRSPYRWQLLAGAAAVASVQAASLYLQRAMFTRPGAADPAGMLAVLGGRVYGTFVLGYRLPNFALGAPWQSVAVAGSAATLVLAAYRGRWSIVRCRIAAAGCCVTLPAALRFLREPQALASVDNGDRYFFLAHVLLGWLLVIAACEGPRRWRAVPVGVLLLALGANLTSLSAPPMRHYEWAAHAPEIRAGRALNIRINPEGWTIATPPVEAAPPPLSVPAAPAGRPQH